MKKLSIIIPVYNEEATLRSLFQKVSDIDISALGYTKQIVFANDGSKDKSEEIIYQIIKDFGDKIEIKYSKTIKNLGKGSALKEGFKNADGELMIIQDADLEYFPEKDYIPMIKEFEEKKPDFIYGSRTLGIKEFGNHYSSRSFMLGGLVVSRLTRILSFTKVTDEPTCYKMFDKKLKKYLLFPSENGFEREPAITMILLRKGFKYIEVPIHYKARKFTEGKKINWRDGVKALITLIKRRIKPIRI